MSYVESQVTDAVAVLRLNNPPVNSLGLALRSELLAALSHAAADAGVAAIVIIGSGKGFSGGADIRELGTSRSMAEPNLPALLGAIEDCAKPVVAAIDGICMGGGFELALACHYRVATAAARLAFPEVKLGLLPGAGGTQRLPRLVGVATALEMIVKGNTVNAQALQDTRLFDLLAMEDLPATAVRFARSLIAGGKGAKKVRDLAIDVPDAQAILQRARDTVRAESGPYPAPPACIEAVAAAVQGPFEAGLKRERELFVALMASPESAALRHIFQAERAAGHVRGVPDTTPVRPLNRVGVVGAGTMGGGITMSLINAGLPVVLLESNQEALTRGLATIRRNYQGSVKKGKLTEAVLEQRLALITPTLDYQPLAETDLVIEAVFETMEVKEQVFRRLDTVARPGAILASNTSALDLNVIAGFTKRPQDVVGLHFFSPANLMRLLEVVRGAATAGDVLASAMALARKIGKIAVVAGVCDGFIGNRMIARYFDAAHDLVMYGASPEQVDAALQDFGLAMGPFRMADLAGLDVGMDVRKRRAREFPEQDFADVADILVGQGRFGQKNGAGFYRYEAGARAALSDPKVAAIIDQFRAQRGFSARPVTATEIVERCIYALVNEGARIVEEGIAQRSSDIDIVYLNGYGFPAFRGGPMFYADRVGLPQVVGALRRMAQDPARDPSAWQPAPLLVRLAENGGTLSGWTGSSS